MRVKAVSIQTRLFVTLVGSVQEFRLYEISSLDNGCGNIFMTFSMCRNNNFIHVCANLAENICIEI